MKYWDFFYENWPFMKLYFAVYAVHKFRHHVRPSQYFRTDTNDRAYTRDEIEHSNAKRQSAFITYKLLTLRSIHIIVHAAEKEHTKKNNKNLCQRLFGAVDLRWGWLLLLLSYACVRAVRFSRIFAATVRWATESVQTPRAPFYSGMAFRCPCPHHECIALHLLNK